MIVSVRVRCHGFWNVKLTTDSRGVGLESLDPRPTAGDVRSSGCGSSSGRWAGGLDSPNLSNKFNLNSFLENLTLSGLVYYSPFVLK